MNKFFLIFILLINLIFANENIDFNLAKTYEEKGEIKTALEYYFLLAKKRDNKALFELGKIYFEGKLVKQSIPRAIKYLNQASLLGNIQARYNLGIVYASNKSKQYKDIDKAYEIFFKLANEGHAPSQNKLGLFLTHGIGGIEKDYVKAVKWFEASAKQCYEEAECNLAYMYVNGKGVWKNFGRAHTFAKKGYENSNKTCVAIWNKHHLEKYPKDKGFKFNFFVEPCK